LGKTKKKKKRPFGIPTYFEETGKHARKTEGSKKKRGRKRGRTMLDVPPGTGEKKKKAAHHHISPRGCQNAAAGEGKKKEVRRRPHR